MELRQLRCLIAVAETQHFGRAAQKLGMLPASFGRHIKLLEEVLGGQLLVRTTRHVALTDEGREFVAQARDLVERADQMERSFREGTHGKSRVLRIGAIDSAAAGLMPQLLPRVREAYPEIDVELLEQKTIRLLPKLLSGRLDIAIVRPPETPDRRLEFRPLFSETAVVAMPEDHPLATRKMVDVVDLIDEPLIVPDRGSRPHSHDLTIKLFLEAGYTARIAQIAEEKQTIVSLVSTGVGLAIVPKWASRLTVGGVSFVKLNGPTDIAEQSLALTAVWLKETRHDARDAFLQVFQEHLQELARTA
jgi:DNA-binding transcriptional LysR family regulator